MAVHRHPSLSATGRVTLSSVESTCCNSTFRRLVLLAQRR
jgi:hypothetical protein